MTGAVQKTLINLLFNMADGTFALAGLRVFGNGGGKAPASVEKADAVRSQIDRCVVKMSWAPKADVVGYNVRYGTQKDKLYNNYQILGKNSVTIGNLNSQQKYYFVIDAFNENGITKGSQIIELN